MWQGEGWASRRAVALLVQLVVCSIVLGSESPDRECCDPQYPYLPAPPSEPQTTPVYEERTPTNRQVFIDVTIEQQAIATTTRRPFRTRRPGKTTSTSRPKKKKKKNKETSTRWKPGQTWFLRENEAFVKKKKKTEREMFTDFI